MEETPEEEGKAVDPFEPEGTGIPIDKTKTKFHGKEEKDYLGRSWIVAPSDVKPVDNPHSYLPKKTIHKWYVVRSILMMMMMMTMVFIHLFIGLVILDLSNVFNSSHRLVISYSLVVMIPRLRFGMCITNEM